MNVELYGSITCIHLLVICFYISITNIISKHRITYKKLFIEHTLVWIVGVSIFVIYTGLTFQHDFVIIDWIESTVDVVLLSISFIVIDCVVYFIGKKKLGKIFK